MADGSHAILFIINGEARVFGLDHMFCSRTPPTHLTRHRRLSHPRSLRQVSIGGQGLERQGTHDLEFKKEKRLRALCYSGINTIEKEQ